MSALSGLSPYLVAPTIAGNLNVGNAGANLFSGAGNIVSNPAGAINQFGSNYAAAYNSALQANQANYQNILQGYQQTAAKQSTAQQAISGGYNQLYNTVLGTLGVGQGGAVGAGGAVNQGGNWGVAAPAAQAIADTYAQASGSVLQNAVNSGLGGTSALASLERGPSLDAAKAYGALGANLAQTAAGYESQLGQAGLNYANQANMQNTALANQQLQFMGGVQIPYPSAQAFGGLVSAAAGIQAANRARAGTGGGGAVVNPFGSASAGSQGHIGFGPGAPAPQVMSPPQQQTAARASPAMGVGASEFQNIGASPAAAGLSAGSGWWNPQALSLQAQYQSQQTGNMQYTTDEQGNPMVQDENGDYYDPATGEWIGNTEMGALADMGTSE